MTQMSLSRLGRTLALATFTASLAARTAAAQADSTPARPQGTPVATVDSTAFERARQMVLGGNAVAGRALADSLVQAVPPGTPAFGDALYWRATIAATAADAERDYRRIIIEYALAPHAGDALIALAQLEMSRGDRVSATSHLERFLLESPERSDRPRAGLWLGRLLLEQNNVPKACAVLREADTSVPVGQVELKNQIEYYMPRCVGVETTPTPTPANSAPAPATQAGGSSRPAPTIDSAHSAQPGGAPTPAAGSKAEGDSAQALLTPSKAALPTKGVPPSAAAATSKAVPSSAAAATNKAPLPRNAAPSRVAVPSKAPSPKAAASAPKRQPASSTAKWTVQIAAYQTAEEAESLVSKMKAREFDAYVVRAARIYRVRIGHYATREEALTLLASLKKRGTSGFVTTADPTAR